MITFYHSNETDFDNNGLGVLDRDIQSPDIEEKINDIFTLTFNYPIFAANGSRLAARMIVKADDPENAGQLFRILKLSKSNGMLTAFCYHIFYDLNGNEIPDTNIVGQNGQTAISQMLSKTAVKHGFTGYSDITNTANIRAVRMSPVKFLIDTQTDNNFINRLGGEIRRVNYRIYMNKVRGSDNGATIRWKKSLDSYNATWDYTTVVTRIRPVGYNGIMLPESYVDSPKINDYETIIIKEIQYSDIKAIDPDASSNDENAVPLEQAYDLMRQAAAKEFSENHLDDPTVTLTVNMVSLRNTEEYAEVQQLETINPWDTVTVINERDNLSVKVRLNHYHYNPATHKFISMELGNSQSTFTDIGSKVDHANNTANQANDTANSAAESANGKNSNYYGPSEPSKPVDGDLWYKQNGDKTELWQYDGKSVPPGWVLVVDDATGEEVKQSVDEALKGTQEAIDSANDAVSKANDAVNQAGFANDNVNQAKTDAASALQKALDAYNNADQIKTGLTADIDAVKGQVNLKANQIDVDKLGGRITNAEAQIKLQADQIALTVSKTELTNILGDYATQTWTQSQIKSTADQINLSVSKVQSTVDNMTIADRNLILQSSTWDPFGKWAADGAGFTYNDDKSEITFSSVHGGPGGELKNISKTLPKDGDSVILSVEAYGNGTLTMNYAPNGSDWFGEQLYTLTSNPTRYYYRIAWKNGTRNKFVFYSKDSVARAMTLRRPKMVISNVLNSDWSPAPEDFATDVEFSNLEITVKGIQTTVAGKADQSQVTQLANQITSTVSQLGTPNYVYNPGFSGSSADGWSLGGVYYMSNNDASAKDGVTGLGINLKNIGTAGTTTFKTAISKRMPYNGDLSQPISASVNIRTYEITGDVRWFFTIETFNDLTSGRLEYFSSNKITGAQGGWRTSAKVNVKPTKPFKYVSIAYQVAFHGVASAHGMYAKPMMNFGSTVAPYTDSGISASQITQLANDINLRVQKGDVIGQINIEAGKTLIQNNNLILDAKTVTFTGSAFIPNAAITSINADKITAGTLNAANVNVINLNANNITTGTIKGANLSMNLNTGEILFQKGSIRSTDGNLNIDINKGTMAVINQYKSGFYFEDGKLVLNDGWLNGSKVDPKYGSLEYNANYFTVNGLAIKGTQGLTVGTSGYNPLSMFSPVVESGIAMDAKHLEIGSAGHTTISSGKEFFMNFLTQQPFILVGTTAKGSSVKVEDAGSRISLYAEYVHIQSAYSKTASGSANVIVSADGALVRSTSASKYKTDIIRTNVADYGEKLLELPTATWTDIAETKRYRDDPANQIKPTRNFGMIAEDLAEAGLEMLVVRGTDGELEGINYDRIGPALIPVIAKLKNEVEILKQKLEEKTA